MARKWVLAAVAAVLVVLAVVWVLFGFALAGRQAYEAGDYQQALAYFARTPFFPKDALAAQQALDHQNAMALLRGYKKDEDVHSVIRQAAALTDAKALQGIMEQDPLRAAEGMLEETEVSPAQWLLIYDALWGEAQDAEDFLARIKGRAMLLEAISGESGVDMEAIMKAAGEVRTLSGPEALFALDSPEGLVGGEGVLFVTEKRLFGTADTQLEVCTQLMQALPADRIPEGLQARFLVVLSYDYEQIGRLDNGMTQKLREFGRVTVYDENGVVYASEVMYANEPGTMCISAGITPYVSGGPPQLALAVRRALLAMEEA